MGTAAGRCGGDHHGSGDCACERSRNHVSARRGRAERVHGSGAFGGRGESSEAGGMRKTSTRRRERGHAMLELAVSAAVMISCLGGTFQFGYTFYVYNQVVTAVGNGARYAAQRTYRAATADRSEERRVGK